MIKKYTLRSLARANAVVAALVLASASLLPTLFVQRAEAAQLGTRFIDMSSYESSGGDSSEGSGRDGGDVFGQDVTYTVSFTLNSAHSNLRGVVVQFCDESPIIGDTCTTPAGFDLNQATLAVANDTDSAHDISGWTKGGDADTLILSDGTGVAASSGDVISFDLGTTADGDGITDPTDNGTFYARIITYDNDANATAYTNGTPGTHVDEGGVALAVANELTITARVQEVLEFCIGTETDSSITPATGDDCTNNVAGTDLDLGVVDSSSIATTSTIDTPNDGIAMIRTNALDGAVIYYKAEQENDSGALKQTGTTCISATSLSDACFNSVNGGDGTRGAITAGTEAFGVALKDRITTTGGVTDSLRCDADYQGDGTAECTGAVSGNNYAWYDNGQFDILASSSGPIDDELVALEFAATAAPTTPTGVYTVTANFVATATY